MNFEPTVRGYVRHATPLHCARNHGNRSGMGTSSVPTGPWLTKCYPISITYHTNDQVGSSGTLARVAIQLYTKQTKRDKERVRELTHMKGRHCSLTLLPL